MSMNITRMSFKSLNLRNFPIFQSPNIPISQIPKFPFSQIPNFEISKKSKFAKFPHVTKMDLKIHIMTKQDYKLYAGGICLPRMILWDILDL